MDPHILLDIGLLSVQNNARKVDQAPPRSYRGLLVANRRRLALGERGEEILMSSSECAAGSSGYSPSYRGSWIKEGVQAGTTE